MKNVYFILGLSLFLGIACQQAKSQEKSKLNPQLDIPDESLQELHGAYSVVNINDDGQTQHINVKFDHGKLVSFVLNGQELPQDQWAEHQDVIKEYIGYLSDDEAKTYKYKQVYDLEHDLRKDIEHMEQTIRQLEISKRLQSFYHHELKDLVDDLEKELNKSEFVQDMEKALDDLLKDMEQFLEERRLYWEEQDAKCCEKK